MLYFLNRSGDLFTWLGLVEFEQCAIFGVVFFAVCAALGLVEFEQCAILARRKQGIGGRLGLVEFEQCAILKRSKTNE